MKRSHALALSCAALLTTFAPSAYAQAIRPGQQCLPAVANPAMYRNCRLTHVNGSEVCRCGISPAARRALQASRSENDLTTGAIGSRQTIGFGSVREGRGAVGGSQNGAGGLGAVGGGSAASGGVSSGLGAGGTASAGASAGAAAANGAGASQAGTDVAAGGNIGGIGNSPGNSANAPGHSADRGSPQGNNGFGNGGHDGSPNGMQDNTR